MNTILRRIWFDTCRRPCFWVGLITTSVGLWLLLPFDSFVPPWTVLGRLLPEWLSGSAIAGLGLWMVAAAYRRDLVWLVESSFGCFLLWCWLSFTSLQTAPQAPSNSVYPVLALMALAVYLWMRMELRATGGQEGRERTRCV